MPSSLSLVIIRPVETRIGVYFRRNANPRRQICGLTYRSREQAGAILLSVQTRLGSLGPPYPFAYQFIEPTRERRFPLIRIVAGPGVSVSLKHWPRHWIESRETAAIQVVRVQAPAVIPRMATDVHTSRLCGTEEINPPERERGRLVLADPRPINYFVVRRLPRETYLHLRSREQRSGSGRGAGRSIMIQSMRRRGAELFLS